MADFYIYRKKYPFGQGRVYDVRYDCKAEKTWFLIYNGTFWEWISDVDAEPVVREWKS